MSTTRLCLAGAAILAIAACWLALRRSPVPDAIPTQPFASRTTGAPVAELALAAGEARSRAPAVPVEDAGADEVRVETPPSRDLLALLEAVARAERERRVADLEARVLEALAPPFGVPAVLRVLARPESDAGADAHSGGIATLVLAAVRERAAGSDATLLTTVRALPDVVESARTRLATALGNLSVEGRAVIGAHLWRQLLDLQRAHRALADDLAPLFASLHLDRDALDAQLPQLLEAIEMVEFPSVVTAAARCLWALDPTVTAALVANLRSRDGLPPELARELARFAALHLEPRAAIDSLGSESSSTALAGMLVLGERGDAREALRTKYSELVVAGTDERQRRNVVFGMRHEETAVLLGIAESDPSPRVREQALLTLSSTRAVDAAAVATLRALRHAGSASVGAQAIVTVAGNIVVKSPGRARDEALALLREIAQDASAGAADRQRAVDLLEKHAPDQGGPADGDAPGSRDP